jgi:hypothetical protein
MIKNQEMHNPGKRYGQALSYFFPAGDGLENAYRRSFLLNAGLGSVIVRFQFRRGTGLYCEHMNIGEEITGNEQAWISAFDGGGGNGSRGGGRGGRAGRSG